jgi:hypothetical protein
MKIAIILLPDDEIAAAKVQFFNMTDVEKEQAFDLLDAELHDITYNQLDDELSSLRALNEELQESLDYYEEAAAEEAERKRVCGF